MLSISDTSAFATSNPLVRLSNSSFGVHLLVTVAYPVSVLLASALFSLLASSLLPAPLLPKIAHAVAVIGQSSYGSIRRCIPGEAISRAPGFRFQASLASAGSFLVRGPFAYVRGST